MISRIIRKVNNALTAEGVDGPDPIYVDPSSSSDPRMDSAWNSNLLIMSMSQTRHSKLRPMAH
jgi:hypothetical protein